MNGYFGGMKMLACTFLLWLRLTNVFAQVPYSSLRSTAVSIDHVPVVVRDLESIKNLLSETLHFKVKAGKPHAGIENCFVKFQDGTYLEFITPLDSTPDIGKYYTRFLKQRQGGTSLAISVQSAETVKKELRAKNIAFTSDSNQVWKTVEPSQSDLFYIEYADKSWKDTQQNTSHPNGALSLRSVWIISANVGEDTGKYSEFGFTNTGKEVLLDVPAHRLAVGSSTLFLIDQKNGKRLTSGFSARELTGICGFTLKVNSLGTLKNRLPKSDIVRVDTKRILYFLNEYNLFLEFIE
ncbi:VOC family protein [Salmonirosea aquatica]|uniref:Glyoxalase-like domain-containing protein n=1 Tax=Salmonirosea aquatica TaxID=2654236 RepID=A0A7C9BTN6_9BACT|nr:hypothetical protein [Cytophagaceae bacterium SJW1-29]